MLRSPRRAPRRSRIVVGLCFTASPAEWGRGTLTWSRTGYLSGLPHEPALGISQINQGMPGKRITIITPMPAEFAPPADIVNSINATADRPPGIDGNGQLSAHHWTDRTGLLAGGLAIVATGVLTACGPTATESPSVTTTPASSSATPSPAEKAVAPTALKPLPSLIPTTCVGGSGQGCPG
jgi:hypothetical protein